MQCVKAKKLSVFQQLQADSTQFQLESTSTQEFLIRSTQETGLEGCEDRKQTCPRSESHWWFGALTGQTSS